MSHLTDDELTAMQASDLPREPYFIIRGVSQTQFSIARHYGRCKFNGSDYTYIDDTDELIRDDVLAWLAKRRKVESKAAKPAKVKRESRLLFDDLGTSYEQP